MIYKNGSSSNPICSTFRVSKSYNVKSLVKQFTLGGWLEWHTFPDTRPQDVSIVNVHHNPLTIQRIFVHGSMAGVNTQQLSATQQWRRTCTLADRC